MKAQPKWLAPSDTEWFDLMCESYKNPPAMFNKRYLPNFPPDDLQRNTTGKFGIETLEEAFFFYQDCLEAFRLLGKPIQPKHSLLDFGVGWGRVTRFFLRDVPQENLFGIDVMPEFVDICKTSFQSNNFIATKPFPPTPIPSKRFDFVIGYSVFSHLSEHACLQWMIEFSRILVPGGIAILTTRGRSFLDVCESLKGRNNLDGYQKSLSTLFDDFEAARRRYDDGQFVHSNIEGVSGGGTMNSSFYGETLVPESYARRRYSEYFALKYFLFTENRHSQPMMVFHNLHRDR